MAAVASKEVDLADAVIDAVRKVALGPDHAKWTSCYPLTAKGYYNDPDYWWGTDAQKAKNRPGNPTIQINLHNELKVALMCSKKGRNPIVFVTSDIEVVILDKQ